MPLAGLLRQVSIHRSGVIIKILDSVVVDFILLQEGVNFHASGEAEDLADLLHGQAAVAVGRGYGVLEQEACGIGTGRHDVACELVRDFDCHLHRASVALSRSFKKAQSEGSNKKDLIRRPHMGCHE